MRSAGIGFIKVAAALVAATFALSACSAGARDDVAPPTNSASSTLAVAVVAPSTLVGAWGAEGPGIPTGTVIAFSMDELTPQLSLSRPGCFLFGGWRTTTGGLFIGQTSGGQGECPEFAEGSVSSNPLFLQQARLFGRVSGQLVLATGDGTVVATLAAGATPISNPNAVPELSSIPTLTEAARVELDTPPTAVANTTSVAPAQIVGSWRPEKQNNPASFLRFDEPTGRWSSSDGCNGNGGVWGLAASGGSFLAVGGGQDLIGCNNDDTSSIQGASYAGFDGEVLVFGDKDGKVVGRFIRSPTPTSS